MKALLAPLAELADYEEIRKNRTKENGCNDSNFLE